MGLRLIRQESETPNVSNHDDARMVRYAYGGYDGYVKNRGQEIGSTVSGTSFVVLSGVLSLQGWEVEVDANGVSIPTSASVTNKTYYSVYLEVNCATDAAEIKSLTDAAGFPDIPASDDLTENTIGTARLLLYHFTATGGVIADVEKMVQGISYMDEIIADINQRLDEMGFKEASIENGEVALQSGWSDAESPICIVQKLGKFAILKNLDLGTKSKIDTSNTAYISSSGRGVTFGRISLITGVLAVLPEIYRPAETVMAMGEALVNHRTVPVEIVVNTAGEVTARAESVYVQANIYVNENAIGYIRAKNIGWELP